MSTTTIESSYEKFNLLFHKLLGPIQRPAFPFQLLQPLHHTTCINDDGRVGSSCNLYFQHRMLGILLDSEPQRVQQSCLPCSTCCRRNMPLIKQLDSLGCSLYN